MNPGLRGGALAGEGVMSFGTVVRVFFPLLWWRVGWGGRISVQLGHVAHSERIKTCTVKSCQVLHSDRIGTCNVKCGHVTHSDRISKCNVKNGHVTHSDRISKCNVKCGHLT